MERGERGMLMSETYTYDVQMNIPDDRKVPAERLTITHVFHLLDGAVSSAP
jgi:hypothetical protein